MSKQSKEDIQYIQNEVKFLERKANELGQFAKPLDKELAGKIQKISEGAKEASQHIEKCLDK